MPQERLIRATRSFVATHKEDRERELLGWGTVLTSQARAQGIYPNSCLNAGNLPNASISLPMQQPADLPKPFCTFHPLRVQI